MIFILKKIFPPRFREKLKRTRRKLNVKSFLIKRNSLDDMRYLLTHKLSISKGDKLFITSSFGNLHGLFSPLELIELLKEIVSEEGLIMMPFYPPGSNEEWAAKDMPFDMNKTKSSMGVLTNIFAKQENVFKSCHPTKSVVVWGKNACEIIKNHNFSKTPFDINSPYGYMLNNYSKSLSLGVEKFPMFHSCEDLFFQKKYPIYKGNIELNVIDNNNLIKVKTPIHNNRYLDSLVNIGKYIRINKHNLNSYTRNSFGLNYCVSFLNEDLIKFCRNENSNNRFREK